MFTTFKEYSLWLCLDVNLEDEKMHGASKKHVQDHDHFLYNGKVPGTSES